MSSEDKILIRSPRDHKGGHLFEVTETAVDWIEQYQHFKGVTKSILELLNLISLRGFSSKDGFVSTTELIDATDGKLTRAAIQQRLRAAVNIGLFSQHGVRFEEGLAGKTMLHRFINPNQLVSVLGATSLVTESVKQSEKQKKSKALAQTQVNKRLLNEHGYIRHQQCVMKRINLLSPLQIGQGSSIKRLHHLERVKVIKNQWFRSPERKP